MLDALLWLLLAWARPAPGPLTVGVALAWSGVRALAGVADEVSIRYESGGRGGATRETHARIVLRRWPEPHARLELGDWRWECSALGVLVAHRLDPTRHVLLSEEPYESWRALAGVAPPLPTPHAELADIAAPAPGGPVRWAALPHAEPVRWVSASWQRPEPGAWPVLRLTGEGRGGARAELDIDRGRLIRGQVRSTHPTSGEATTIEWRSTPIGAWTVAGIDARTSRRVPGVEQLGPPPGAIAAGDGFPDVVLANGERWSAWAPRQAPTDALVVLVLGSDGGSEESVAAAASALADGVREARRELTIEAALRGEPGPRIGAVVLVAVGASAALHGAPGGPDSPARAAGVEVLATREPRLLERLAGDAHAAVVVLGAEREVLASRPVDGAAEARAITDAARAALGR